MAVIGTIAYALSALAFYLAGNHYYAFRRNRKYKSIFHFDRVKRGYIDGFKARLPGDP